MAEEKDEPDLTLMEADIRGTAELVGELRKINEQLELLRGGVRELILVSDRVAPLERLVREIAVGLGIKA